MYLKILIILQIILTAVGDYFAKDWAIRGHQHAIFVSMFFYLVSSYVFMMMLRAGQGLATGSAIVSIGYLIGSLLVSQIFFHEHLTWNHWAGIGLGLIAIVFINLK